MTPEEFDRLVASVRADMKALEAAANAGPLLGHRFVTGILVVMQPSSRMDMYEGDAVYACPPEMHEWAVQRFAGRPE